MGQSLSADRARPAALGEDSQTAVASQSSFTSLLIAEAYCTNVWRAEARHTGIAWF